MVLVATAALLLVAVVARPGLVVGVLALAAVFVPLERLFRRHRQPVLRRGWRTDVLHLAVNTLVSTPLVVVVGVAAGLPGRLVVSPLTRHGIAGLPAGVQFVAGLVIAEVAGYWAHRAAHTVPLLWRFHQVHHASEQLDWLAAGHLHPLDTVWTRGMAIAPLVALGFTPGAFTGVTLALTLYAIALHANVRWQWRGLRWVLASPEYHHWHHSSDPGARDTNFATLPVVDALFGTRYQPADRRPQAYGVEEPQPSGYVRQLLWPFRGAPVRSLA